MSFTADSRQCRHHRQHCHVQQFGDAARSDPVPPGMAAAPTSTVTDDVGVDADGVEMVLHEHLQPPGRMS